MDIKNQTNTDETTSVSLHDTAYKVPERPAYRLLQDTAAGYPDRTALIAADRSLTYKELNGEANAVGHVLKDAGAGPETIVAVMAQRNSYAYVMRQGVLKSGGAFLPVDPEYPEDRIRFILEDSGAGLILTTKDVLMKRKKLFDALKEKGIEIIEAESAVQSGNKEDINAEVPYEALAYVIYTSGSTGTPKGVMLTNKNLVNFVDDNEKNLEVQGYTKRGHVSLSIAALTFDVSVMEEFIPIANGMTAVLATQDEIMNPMELAALMKKTGVDLMTCTPSYLMNMLDMSSISGEIAEAVRDLKSIDIGAEAFPAALYDKLVSVNPDLYIMNGYGPTEATISCTMKVIDSSADITIGIPAANVTVAIMDEEGKLLPTGELGELVIMGDGVGRGYIGRDDLNERSFIKVMGKNAYRSGDIARIREDGNIEYHGRMDDQVKLRGLRVELGEIESVMNSYRGILTSVVTVVKGETDYLAAYFTADDKIDIKALKEYLGSRLTAYMVPQAFMQLEAMPLTANGKVDKKSLPEIAAEEEEIVLPENETQEKILEQVRKVIPGTRTGITTNLFSAGLSSIGCMRLCALLYESFGRNIKTAQLYENNTVKDIERLIIEEEAVTDYGRRYVYPLSMTQTGIYIECERHPGSTIYNIPLLYKLDPEVDLTRLKKAIESVARCHPYLYMRPLKSAGGELSAVRRDDQPFEAKIIECEKLPCEEELVRVFDLNAEDVLFRAEIYKTADGNYFFFDTHHIVSDGGSIDILISDIDKSYKEEAVETESYTGYEYALDEAAARNSDRYKKAKAWYYSVFAGCSGETLPVKDGDKGEVHIAFERTYGAADIQAVRKYCEDNSLTLNAFFTAAFGLALSAYTSSEQAVFTAIYNGRNDLRLEHSVSMLVKTLPVYLPYDGSMGVKEYIENCQNYLLTAMANDIYSFSEIRREYDIKAEIMLAYQGEFEHGATIGGRYAELTPLSLSYARAAIGIDILLDGDRVVFEKEYDPAEYSEYTVRGIVKLIDHIAGEMVVKEKLNDITLVSKEDENGILSLYDTDYPVNDRPAYRLLQDAAEKYPDKIKVIAVDRSLTHKELNEEANALGHILKDNGAGPETKVAVLADRDSYAYVMREGVLKSGGAFIPIDPEYPEDRVRFIIEDSGAGMLVTTSSVIERRRTLIDSLEEEGIKIIKTEEAVAEGSKENLNAEVFPDNLAYVIYTSGSTRSPKGVMLTNRNLVNFADDNEKNGEDLSFVDKADVLIAIAPLTFDVSMIEEFVGYSRGKTTVLATMEQFMDADKMRDLIINNHVDFMTCTPTYLLNMIEIDAFKPAVKCFKSIDVGAEAFPPVLYEKLMKLNPELYVVNTYGPTECTVTCTLKEVVSTDDITIGKPLANVKMATFDREGRLQPPGAMGELIIMGTGVGRGYIGRDDLNERNFIKVLGLPAYRSGDLVRIKENGEIDFHGRMDNQVKLRGLRVELGEIESVLSSYPGIRACTVIVVKGETDYLAAYFTADTETDIRSLREHLASRLTDYMVPQAFMQLDEMPLTANGKVDKKALPEISVISEEIVPAQNGMQNDIMSAVLEVLQGARLGVTNNLFESGLSSIGSIRLCALLSERFGVNVRVAEIFENKTVIDIERLITQKLSGVSDSITVDYELRDTYPLSMTQTGIYIECEKYPDTTIYNIPELYKLDNEVDTDRLEKAIKEAVSVHPYLFMRVVRNEKGEAVAKRRDDSSFNVKRVKNSQMPDIQGLSRPFDLDSDEILCRAEIYETDEGNYLFIDTHHIVCDGESEAILLRDINSAYEGAKLQKEEYTGYEYALDEEAARKSSRLNKAKYWYDSIFAGCGGETMPVKDVSGAKESQDKAHIGTVHIKGETGADMVRDFCADNSLSLNAFFITAFGIALKSYTASEQAVFSTIYNGRNDPRLHNSVSMLVKTLPVMYAANPSDGVLSAVENCRNYLVSAMSNDIYSFSEIRNAYDIKADIMFTYQGEYGNDVIIGSKKASWYDIALDQAKAMIDIDSFLGDDKIVFEAEFDPSCYSEYTVTGLIRLTDNILTQMCSKSLISDMEMVTDNDRRDILNLHDSSYPVADRPAYRLLQDQADKNRYARALVAKDRILTYRHLNEEANALGHCLREMGAGPGTIVAVLAERNSYAYVMRQGVLKSGGAFLPIDPEYPEDRIRFILEDSGTKLLVTTGEVITKRQQFLEDLSSSGIRIINVCDAVKDGNTGNLNIAVSPDAPAYVIYTSGSTGRPKGVMLMNKNLVNFVDDNEKNHEIQGYTKRGHVSLAIAALTFDFSIMEEFVPIANGMTVVLATHDQIMNPIALAELMRENHVDVMSCTPSYLMNLLDMGEYTDVFTNAVKELKSVDMGAEAFPPALFDKLKAVNPGIYIMNGYGPTEATISCTMQVIENTDDITIGIPNVNVSVCTIDRDLKLQPLGALGEMVIMGDGVGKGYIGRDDLTEKCFIEMLGKRAYRSGDLVRIREDGNIEFHGRIDNQVKLRGLRVEIGEIESVINSYPGIGSCIVIVVKKETEYLAAYFTADDTVDTASLKEYLASKLTEYMVPQVFMQLDRMPLTANGKIDKKALPSTEDTQERVVEAKNETQKALVATIREVIGDVPVGIATDLFSAGLSSIACIRLCALLSNRFETNIQINDVFENKTVIALEKVITQKKGEIRAERELMNRYPLSMTQTGIFIESIKYAGTTVYNIPYLFRLDSSTDMKRYKEAVETAFRAHPYIFMTLEQGDDDEIYAVRNEVYTPEIGIYSTLPDRSELVRPFDLLSREPLYRVSLYETEEGKYLFTDLHHIIADGESYEILLRDIDDAYNGKDVAPETYTGYEAALDEKEARESDRYRNALKWYDSVFGGCKGVTLPAALREEKNNPDESKIGTMQRNGSMDAQRLLTYCEKNSLSLNAFFTTAFGLALKAYTGSDNAVFTTIYNGRSDPRTVNSVAMFVKTMPVLLRLEPTEGISDAIADCGSFLINAMANDIVSFSEVRNRYGIESDVLFAYQGESHEVYEEDDSDIALSQAKALFGLDISIEKDAVIYEFEYDPSVYGSKTIDTFCKLLDAVITGMLTESRMSDILKSEKIMALIPLAAHKGTISRTVNNDQQADINKDSAAEQADISRLTEMFCGIFKKVLSAAEVRGDSNFFEMGGTSLAAAKVMMAAMAAKLPIVYQDVFDHPTPAELAGIVARKNAESFGEMGSGHSTEETVSETDETAAHPALKYNCEQYLHKIPLGGGEICSSGNVVLAGATGFLGIHVLHELMDTDVDRIYCLINCRGKDGMERLQQEYFYYFDSIDKESFISRIVVLDADITDPESLKILDGYDFNSIINCAACVKHFAREEIIKQVNVYGVQNLAEICIEKDVRLIHVSTVSVAGDTIGDSRDSAVLMENSFELGQEVESNIYVHTKYLAEKYVLNAIENKGLKAKIMRVGNLMSRLTDGEFQINFQTNNFMNTLKAYAAIGCYPVQKMYDKDEYSPVDEVARAILMLAGTPDEFTVFHTYNSHSVEMGDVIYALNEAGIKIDVVEDREFEDRLREAVRDESLSEYVSPLVSYNLDDDTMRTENDVDNTFTVNALYRLGFKWSLTDMEYIVNSINMLVMLDFFN